MKNWILSAPEGFRLLPVIYSHGWFQCPPFHWDSETNALTRVLRLSSGDLTVLTLKESAPGTLTVSSSADVSNSERDKIQRSVARILSFGLDLTPFYELCDGHETLERARRMGAGRLLRCPNLWEEMSKAICGTNVQWTQAVSMISKLAELGDPVGDDRHAWPTPEQVAAAGTQRLRDHCRVGYRADYLAGLAESVAEGSLDVGPAERGELSGDEIREFFLSVKGIGKATAAYLTSLSGHFSEISIDSAVYAFTSKKYFGGRRPKDAEIVALYKDFGEWKGLAYWFDAVISAWWPSSGIAFDED
jgi:3-methyladenine DNA glycosylase/8-oxoguanine DNA glycosylase